MKILIVEDDPLSQQLLSRYLKDQGETVITEDGARAVDLFRNALEAGQSFQLVCLDIMLPSLDGQQVLKQIRAIEEAHNLGGLAGCPVIMLTALRDSDSVMSAFRGQAEAYVPKPYNKQRLLKEMRALGLPVKETE